jgi:hypothetical protein
MTDENRGSTVPERKVLEPQSSGKKMLEPQPITIRTNQPRQMVPSQQQFLSQRQQQQINYLYTSEKEKTKSFWDRASSSDKFLLVAVVVIIIALGVSQALLFVAGYYIQSRIQRALVSSASSAASIGTSVSSARRSLSTGQSSMSQRIAAQKARTTQLIQTERNALDNKFATFSNTAVQDIRRTNLQVARSSTKFADTGVRVAQESLSSMGKGISSVVQGTFSFILGSAGVIVPAAVIDGVISGLH